VQWPVYALILVAWIGAFVYSLRAYRRERAGDLVGNTAVENGPSASVEQPALEVGRQAG